MTLNDRKIIVKKAENMAADILRTVGRTHETVLILVKNLYQYGEKLVESIEREKGVTHKIECKMGCSYCCFSQVSLTPPEAFLIGHFIKENYSLKKTDDLMKRASSNLRLTKDKTIEERIDIWETTPCIFLNKDICSIYEVRPLICRAWHSLSVEQCKKAFESGDKNSEIDSTPYRNIIYGAIREGLSRACKDFGCDSDPFVITSSIKIILNHPGPEEAWIKGDSLFHS